MQPRRTWRDLIEDTLGKMPEVFSLDDVRKFESRLAREYPQNRNIDAKIRQTLQILRDQGVLRFLGAGKYQRLGVAPSISLHFDPAPAARYTSRSQIARVSMETWAELSLYCLTCYSDRLKKLPDNTPLADFSCPLCGREYQLKSKNGRFASLVPGAEYRKMIAAARAVAVPEYFLAEYDVRWSMLFWVRALPGAQITEDRVIARKPLRATAKRAGWTGCNINVNGIPWVDVIAPKAQERQAARDAWRHLIAAK